MAIEEQEPFGEIRSGSGGLRFRWEYSPCRSGRKMGGGLIYTGLTAGPAPKSQIVLAISDTIRYGGGR